MSGRLDEVVDPILGENGTRCGVGDVAGDGLDGVNRQGDNVLYEDLLLRGGLWGRRGTSCRKHGGHRIRRNRRRRG